MQLFYAPAIENGHHLLDREESWHCVRVLRMNEGDEVHLTDGRGGWYRSVITDANPKGCMLQMVEKNMTLPRITRLHMAVAPTKNIDRFEWFLEKATECGIDEITPVFCEQSERHIIKAARLEKVIVAAMKQSLRCWLPKINQAIQLDELLAGNFQGDKFIAHCGDSTRSAFREQLIPGRDTMVLIGPEGDFSAAEVEAATQAGFLAISLGAYRLRTETAAMAACVGFNWINAYL